MQRNSLLTDSVDISLDESLQSIGSPAIATQRWKKRSRVVNTKTIERKLKLPSRPCSFPVSWPDDLQVSYDLWKYADNPPAMNAKSKFRVKRTTKLPSSRREVDALLKDRDCWIGLPISVDEAPSYKPMFIRSAYLAPVVTLPPPKIEILNVTRDAYLVSLGWNRYQQSLATSAALDKRFQSTVMLSGPEIADSLKAELKLDQDTPETSSATSKYNKTIHGSNTAFNPRDGHSLVLDTTVVIKKSVQLFNQSNAEDLRNGSIDVNLSALKASPLVQKPMRFGLSSSRLRPFPRESYRKTKKFLKYRTPETKTDKYQRTVVKWGLQRIAFRRVGNLEVPIESAQTIIDQSFRKAKKRRRIMDRIRLGAKPPLESREDEYKLRYSWFPLSVFRSTFQYLYPRQRDSLKQKESQKIAIQPAFLTDISSSPYEICGSGGHRVTVQCPDTELIDSINAEHRTKSSSGPLSPPISPIMTFQLPIQSKVPYKVYPGE